jgi:hypothetical protein
VSASRSSAVHENGQAATGRASCIARSPAPIAVTAAAGSACHRGEIALSPGTADVISHDPAPSAPRPMTWGTVV